MTATIAPYEDYSAEQRHKALEADLRVLRDMEQRILDERGTVALSVVCIANAIRTQGEALRRLCGHEQVTFSFLQGLKEKQPALWSQFPESWGDKPRDILEVARKRVAFASKLDSDKRIAKWGDIAVEAKRDVLRQIELLTSCSRGATGEASTPNDPFVIFLGDLLRLKQSLQKCLRLKEMEKRPKGQLEDFIGDTQWVVEARELARKILQS